METYEIYKKDFNKRANDCIYGFQQQPNHYPPNIKDKIYRSILKNNYFCSLKHTKKQRQ